MLVLSHLFKTFQYKTKLHISELLYLQKHTFFNIYVQSTWLFTAEFFHQAAEGFSFTVTGSFRLDSLLARSSLN